MTNLLNGKLFSTATEADKELLILYIEITENNTQVLTVHKNDNIEDLVNKFCIEKQLSNSAKAYITDEIEKNIQYFYPNLGLLDTLDLDLKKNKHNKGLELYSRGQQMREKAEKKREMIRNQRKMNEDKLVTLRPNINKSPKRTKKTETILLEKGRKTAENLNKKRSLIEDRVRNECTFSPEINNKNERRSPERYQRLYDDAKGIHEKIIKKSQELINMNCPFEPNFELTKKKTEQLIKNLSRSNTVDHTRSPRAHSPPRLSKSPSSKKSKFDSPRKNSKTLDHSDQLFRKVKRSRFEKIFNELLPNSKGLITRETVYKSKLQSVFKDILKPILVKIEVDDERYSLLKFIDEMEVLFKGITVAEKAVLLKTNKRKIEDSLKSHCRSVSSNVFMKSENKTLTYPSSPNRD